MLLEFKAWNYKSFREELCFSMRPSRQRGLDYSIQREKVGNKTYRALCSAVIYGPNAAGKTNIIGAMDTFRAIVLRGHINDAADQRPSTPNAAAEVLSLIPNCYDEAARPIGFQIEFIDQGRLISYSFSADIGSFMQDDVKRCILSERITLDGVEIFYRDKKKLRIKRESDGLDLLKKKGLLVKGLEGNEDVVIHLAENSLKNDELFLENGFKTLFSAELVKQVNQWLQEKFSIIYRSNELDIARQLTPGEKGGKDLALTDLVKKLGMGGDILGFVASKENDRIGTLFSFIENRNKEKKNREWEEIAIAAEQFESYGTVRFAALGMRLLRGIATGITMVVDEFDASLHPMALMNIINIFHNDEINVHHAQLIFNTHNPIFLNRNLFRRDEIKFVERDENGNSTHYSLSDFSTKGEVGTRVRSRSDYMHNYFINSYGAIENVDFFPVFERAVKGGRKGDGAND